MTMQQKLHAKAIEHLIGLENVIDKLKGLGPCELDGKNALMNTRQRLNDLANRCSVAWLKG